MINLAGRSDADTYIQQELQTAEITIMDAMVSEASHSEVPFSIAGQLGPFRFLRWWRYWVVRGPMPLAIAGLLYADPKGRWDIRVNGNAGRPAPSVDQAVLCLRDGRHVLDTSLREDDAWQIYYERILTVAELAQMPVFSDEPLAKDAMQCVILYHIDTQEGLNLFARVVREHCMPATLV